MKNWLKISILTQEQANELFTLLIENDYQWFFRASLSDGTFWEIYKIETVYLLDLDEKSVTFSDREWIYNNLDEYNICGFYAGMAKLNELFKK